MFSRHPGDWRRSDDFPCVHVKIREEDLLKQLDISHAYFDKHRIELGLCDEFIGRGNHRADVS